MATEHMNETPQAATPADVPRGPNKKNKKKILYAALAAGVIVGVGGGGYWWSLRAAPAEDHTTEAPAPHERGLVTFDPFVVNLADANASRYLRVTVRLVVDSPEMAAEVAESPVVLMAARSTILELLTTQTAETLVTPDGKAALRAAIAKQVGHGGELKVVDVLFSDFVVQF